ncbi:MULTISPECIES: ATP-binding protein [unclassified Variovorax]|uniref:ATP-binding protein n=1 Tax=unclassified Variovorax TaxID=663243 RepID=UPI00076C24B1|nr:MULTISPECIES: ATP-binding protein [unclassified Variovorax]KWT98513.1 Sensor histidine kinase PrrB (RegB) [Variovorax sp. WDL1]PNG56808.1 Sensor histidine kinase RegB [Variovorax sp. B4]PNG58232.1 Sensor histidine kinase RegB [Variovorax sp. B2]VTV09254.1 Sensor histidine kinase RegB [Variovorax sp. WDL1]
MQPRTEADATGLKNMQQLIQLRWIAVVGQVATILVVHFGLGIRLPLGPMLGALGFLTIFNLVSLWRWDRHEDVTDLELFVALLADVGTLTVQLYLSGGVTNPFIFLFLLQVCLGAVLLGPGYSRTLIGVTVACFIGLILFHQPLEIPPENGRGLASPYIQGLLVCFALDAALLAIFIARINRNLRARDARLADLRQRAAEEDHIVRMGLLATGAAHELGTPLATLAVILGDWQRMQPFAAEPELRQEIEEMQAQVARCKTIVSGILLSAGEARGEAPAHTTVNAFLDELVAEWRATRSLDALAYSNVFGDDVAIVSDSALKQTLYNVLDNALEASPRWVGLEAAREGEWLRLTVNDAGPGFAPEMLAQLGKPYQSSKGRPGGGLGLFLVVNVARALGGSVSAENRLEGGAAVTLRLPLAALTLEKMPRHGR